MLGSLPIRPTNSLPPDIHAKSGQSSSPSRACFTPISTHCIPYRCVRNGCWFCHLLIGLFNTCRVDRARWCARIEPSRVCPPRGRDRMTWLNLEKFYSDSWPMIPVMFLIKIDMPFNFLSTHISGMLIFLNTKLWLAITRYMVTKKAYIFKCIVWPPSHPLPLSYLPPLRYGAYKFLVPHQINFWCGAQKIGRGNSLIEYFLP